MRLALGQDEGADGGWATLLAALVASAPLIVSMIPDWLSPSNPPTSLSAALRTVALAGLCASLLLTVWLLPICTITYWAMVGAGIRGARASLIAAAAVSALAIGSMVVLNVDWSTRLSNMALERFVRIAAEPSIFVFTWFICIWTLSRRRLERCSVEAGDKVEVARGARKTVVAASAMLLVVAWTGILGDFGGKAIDLESETRFNARFSVPSPGGSSRAWIVERISPPKSRDYDHVEVYLVPASKTWTPQERGLLVWEANRLESIQVAWTSERALMVAPSDTSRRFTPPLRRSYPRNGFEIETAASAPR